MRLGAVVSYCENEHKFLEPCIKSLQSVCDHIVISYCEKYLNGEDQDLSKLKQFLDLNPDICEASFEHEQAFSADPRSGHNFGRIVGYELLKGHVDKIMFVDTDEILDAEKFKTWRQESTDLQVLDHMSLKCHWYYRTPEWQALQKENCISIHDIKCVNVEDLNSSAERWFWHGKANTKIGCCLHNGDPLAHHYSWVRSKDEMLKKIASWGHKSDRDWSALIEACFSSEFTGKPRAELGWRTDIVHNYTYEKVVPFNFF